MNPPTRHVLKLCRAEACQSKGCEKTAEHVQERLGVKFGETTPDEAFTLQEIYCLGNCTQPPAAMLDGKPYGRVTPQVADLLLDEARGSDGTFL